MKLELVQSELPSIILNNTVVIEVSEAREKIVKSWNHLAVWVVVLGEEKEKVEFRNIRRSVEWLNERKRKLSRNKGKEVLEEFLNEKFKLPIRKTIGA